MWNPWSRFSNPVNGARLAAAAAALTAASRANADGDEVVVIRLYKSID